MVKQILFLLLLLSPFLISVSSFAESVDVYEFTAPIFLKELPSVGEYGVQYTLDRNSTILQARTLSGLTTKSPLQTVIIAPKKNGTFLSQNICLGVSRDIGFKDNCNGKLYNGLINSDKVSGRYIIMRPLHFNDSVQVDIGAQFSKDFSSYTGGETFIYHLQYASGTIVTLPLNTSRKVGKFTIQNTGAHNGVSISSGAFYCLPNVCKIDRAEGIRLDGTKFDALALYTRSSPGSEMIRLPSDTASLIIYTQKL